MCNLTYASAISQQPIVRQVPNRDGVRTVDDSQCNGQRTGQLLAAHGHVLLQTNISRLGEAGSMCHVLLQLGEEKLSQARRECRVSRLFLARTTYQTSLRAGFSKSNLCRFSFRQAMKRGHIAH